MTLGKFFSNVGNWFTDGMVELVTLDLLNLTIGQGIFTFFYFGFLYWVVSTAFTQLDGKSILGAIILIPIWFSPFIIMAFIIY